MTPTTLSPSATNSFAVKIRIKHERDAAGLHSVHRSAYVELNPVHDLPYALAFQAQHVVIDHVLTVVLDDLLQVKRFSGNPLSLRPCASKVPVLGTLVCAAGNVTKLLQSPALCFLSI